MNSSLARAQKMWLENAASIFDQHTEERKQQDLKRISEIRSYIEQSEHGKAILDWADTNNVTILIDHQCEKAVGYYCTGKNIVCLNGKYDNYKLINTLCHELRHAWQDSQCLLASYADTPEERAFKTRFTEADAFAYGNLVSFELISSGVLKPDVMDNGWLWRPTKRKIKNALKRDPLAVENGFAYAIAFSEFFHQPEPMGLYDKHALQTVANDLGIISYTKPNVTGEFTNISSCSIGQKGIDLNNQEKTRLIGDVFGKYNYFDALQDDVGKGSIYQTFNGYSKIAVEIESPYYWAKLRRYRKEHKYEEAFFRKMERKLNKARRGK